MPSYNGLTYNTITKDGVVYDTMYYNGVCYMSGTSPIVDPDTHLQYLTIPNGSCQAVFLTNPSSSYYSVEFKVRPTNNTGMIAGFNEPIGTEGTLMGVGSHYDTSGWSGKWMLWYNQWTLSESGDSSQFANNDATIILTHNGTTSTSSVNQSVATYPTSISFSQDSAFAINAYRNTDGTLDSAMQGRWYYVKETLNGALIHNYIPVVRATDSKVCFKDTITNTYIEDTNGQTWVAGPQAN